MSWLDHVPPGERGALLGGVALVLGVPTLALGRLELSWLAADLVAVGAVALAGGAVGLAWRRHGRDGVARLARRRDQAELDRVRDRGIAVSAWRPPVADPLDRLAARDPAFSVPVLLAAIRHLVGRAPAAAPEVVGVAAEGELTVDAIVRAPDGALRVRVACPGDARPPAPDQVPGPWRLVSSAPIAAPPPSPTPCDPAVGAARRALLARDPAFDADALAALAREISAAADAGDERVAPYLSAGGAADLAFWRAVGLPPGGERVEWLEITQDGWFDRLELRVGERVLSLSRPAASSDAPWELWRLRRAA